MSDFRNLVRKSTVIASLTLTALSLGITGCGGGGDSDTSNNGSGSGGGTTSIVASGITLTLNGSLSGHDFWPRNSTSGSVVEGVDTSTNTTFFSGKFRLQRLVSTQATTVLPPTKLSLRAVDVTTGLTMFTTTVPRGTFEPSLDLWNNGASGTWPYSVYVSMGYRVAAGTTIRWYVVDNGDGVTDSGDELTGVQLWQGTPFISPTATETHALDPKASPIPALEITISAAG